MAAGITFEAALLTTFPTVPVAPIGKRLVPKALAIRITGSTPNILAAALSSFHAPVPTASWYMRLISSLFSFDVSDIKSPN